jgi:membrane-associated phospholipid phosphatase
LWGRRAWLTLVYTACVWLSIVYLGEHYIIDIIGGVIFALAVFFGEDAFSSWWHARSVRTARSFS